MGRSFYDISIFLLLFVSLLCIIAYVHFLYSQFCITWTPWTLPTLNINEPQACQPLKLSTDFGTFQNISKQIWPFRLLVAATRPESLSSMSFHRAIKQASSVTSRRSVNVAIKRAYSVDSVTATQSAKESSTPTHVTPPHEVIPADAVSGAPGGPFLHFY